MVDINVDVMLAQKDEAMKAARKSARPITEAIDERGKVSLWLIAQKRWIKVWPVDAMDILRSGTANLDGPEPEPEIVPEPEPEPEIMPEPEPELLVNMTIPKLRDYAKLNNIDVSKVTKRGDILEAIQEAEKASGATDSEETGSDEETNASEDQE